MARRINRWRMYLLCLAADMRDAGVIDEARYRRSWGGWMRWTRAMWCGWWRRCLRLRHRPRQAGGMPNPRATHVVPGWEVAKMPDNLNGLRLRLCSIVWDLVDLGHIGLEDADEMTQRIERMTEREMAAWVRKLAPAELKAS